MLVNITWDETVSSLVGQSFWSGLLRPVKFMGVEVTLITHFTAPYIIHVALQAWFVFLILAVPKTHHYNQQDSRKSILDLMVLTLCSKLEMSHCHVRVKKYLVLILIAFSVFGMGQSS